MSSRLSDVRAVRIVLLSPVRVVREALAGSFGADPTVEILGNAPSADLLPAIRAPEGEWILVYDGSTTEAVTRLRLALTMLTPGRVVVFGLFESVDDLRRCAQLGVQGLVERDDPLAEFVKAIGTVAKGSRFMSASLVPHLVRIVAALPSVTADVLTEREREIAALLARAASDRTICRELGIRLGTLKSHIQHIYHKLGVHERREVGVFLENEPMRSRKSE